MIEAMQHAWGTGYRAGRDAAVARVLAVARMREDALRGRRAGFVTVAVRNLAAVIGELEPPGVTVPDLRVLEVKPDHRAGRGRWWRNDGQGYTDRIEDIGLYAPDDHRVAEYAAYAADDPEAKTTVRTLAEVLAEAMGPALALAARARAL